MIRTCRPSETHRGSYQDSAASSFLHLPPEVLASVIFCCSQETITECLENMIFGLPHPNFAYVQNVQPGMPLFLFNYSGRKMHGVFEAVSCGQMNIDPNGWTRGTGKTPYPAQVRVKVIQLYPSLPEIIFKEVLMGNYYTDKHFCFELDSSQTSKLWSLFIESSSEAVMEPLKISMCYKANLQHNEEDSEQWNRARGSVMHQWNKAVSYIPEDFFRSDGDKRMTNNPYLACSAGSLCYEWEAAGDGERTYDQPSKSSINLSSHLSIDPSCSGKQHRESQCSDWVQQRQHPEARMDFLFPESPTQNLEIAEMVMGLRSLQTLLMQGTSHETMNFPAVQSSVPYEWTYNQPLNLSAYQNVDKELEETGWEHRLLQHQKQQPDARLNVPFPKPNDVRSPDIDLLKITQLSKDLQFLQTSLLQRGFQERTTVPTVEASDVQEMADAWELKELSESRCLQEQAMLREELVKQRESLRVRDISSDNAIQELHDLSATQLEQMRWHRSELKHMVEEICTELGYFKEVDELGQRNTMLEYTQIIILCFCMASETALDGVDGDGKTHIEDEAWNPLEFVHEPPVLSVTQPKGSFCQIDARFSVPLPPDDVYNIITDPNNRHVFKNIKEVAYRKVLQDDGNKQIVEVEQVGRWRFLMISGTFACRVLVEQDRKQHTMIFDLVKQGMMKKFSGSWKIDGFDVSLATSNGVPSDTKDGEHSEKEVQVGSWITFSQVVEPAIVPPWPLNGYVRGVTGKIVREILGDLQRECIHLAKLKQGDGGTDTKLC